MYGGCNLVQMLRATRLKETILQECNEVAPVIISSFTDEDMQPMDLTQSFAAQSRRDFLN